MVQEETQRALCGMIFLGDFRKIAKSDYWLRHVCPSAWNNSAPNGRIFMKFDTIIFRKSFKKIDVSLQSYNNKW